MFPWLKSSMPSWIRFALSPVVSPPPYETAVRELVRAPFVGAAIETRYAPYEKPGARPCYVMARNGMNLSVAAIPLDLRVETA